jgi:hypothetical protein
MKAKMEESLYTYYNRICRCGFTYKTGTADPILIILLLYNQLRSKIKEVNKSLESFVSSSPSAISMALEVSYSPNDDTNNKQEMI